MACKNYATKWHWTLAQGEVPHPRDGTLRNNVIEFGPEGAEDTATAQALSKFLILAISRMILARYGTLPLSLVS
jgi:hypothetical protein